MTGAEDEREAKITATCRRAGTECQLRVIPDRPRERTFLRADRRRRDAGAGRPDLHDRRHRLARARRRSSISLICVLALRRARHRLGRRSCVGAGSISASTRARSWGIALLVLAQFALSGATTSSSRGSSTARPRQAAARIRVVRDGGYSVTFGASAVRNLVRIDRHAAGLFYLVGIIGVLSSRVGSDARRHRGRHDRRAGRLCAPRRPRRHAPPRDADDADARSRRAHRRRSTRCSSASSSDGRRWTARAGARRSRSSSRRASPRRCPTTAARRARACSTSTSASGARARGRGRRAARRARAASARRSSRRAARAGTAFAARSPRRRRRGLALARRGRRPRVRARSTARCPRTSRGCAPRRAAATPTRCSTSAGSSPARTTCSTASAACRSAPRVRFLFTDVPREIRRSARPIAAGRAAAVRAGDDRGTCGGADPTRVGAAAGRHARARRGRRRRAPDGRGIHRGSAAVPPRDGARDHRQQRAGDLRRVRGRHHGRDHDRCSCWS